MILRNVILGLTLLGGVALGATASSNSINKNTLGNAKKQLLGNFASGSVVSGSTYAGSGARRWYLFNEGHLGYSYSKLGDLNLHSVDVGYSMYISSIKAAGGIRPYVGTEITVPIYIKSTGNSNAFSAPTGLPGDSKVMTDISFNGLGIQVPVIVGAQMGSFYIQGMVGYSYHYIRDRFYVSDVQNDTELENNYQGLTYGLGAGMKFSNVFSVGLRWVTGELTSSARSAKAPIPTNAVRTKDFKDNYHRFSIIFGVVF